MIEKQLGRLKHYLNYIPQNLGGNETQRRVKTAALGITMLLFLLTVGGHFGTALLTAIITAGMCIEISNVIYKMPDKQEKVMALLGVSWLMLFANFLVPKSGLETLIMASICYFIYFLGTAERHPENLKIHFKEFVYTFFVLVYVVLFMSFLPLIRKGPNGLKWALLFFFMIWACDSLAYFAGKKFGKTKIYPLISPKKSVEGAVCGLAGALLVSIIFKLFFFREMGTLATVLIPIIIGALSQIGDLCESFFKRAFDIKDSGQILPGHGGFLDRFDGVLFTLPVMYLLVKIFS